MESKENKKTKVNKTWILVAILVIFTAVLLIVSLTAKNPITIPSKSKEAEKDFAQTSLIFSDNVRQSTAPGAYEVDINIDSGENKVTLAQLEMSYDPKIITRVDLRPGDFIDDPVIIQKSIITQEGRIKYWIGIKPNQNGIRGKGVIATLVFSKPGTGAAQITFLPKTSISATGTDQSVLKNMVSGYILNFPSLSESSFLSPAPSISQISQ